MGREGSSCLELTRVTRACSNDMQNKSEYGKMVNVTYAISCSAYVVMACAGYLMFGNSAQSEVRALDPKLSRQHSRALNP